MTKDDAIVRLKRHTLCDNTGFCDEDDVEATKIAIRAIEKQIQRRPKAYKAMPRTIYLCPSCGSTFVDRAGIVMNYCNNCGQAIDFSEVE